MHDYEGFKFIGSNEIILLNAEENKILRLLLKKKAVSYEDIQHIVSNTELDKYSKKAIVLRIYRLRQKLKDDVKIRAIRGYGYIVD